MCCSTSRSLKITRCLLGLMVLAFIAGMPAAALAQFHGIGVAKQCSSPKLVGQTTNCLIIAANNIDTDGDTLTVSEMYDVVQALPSNVRVPVAGNLPITAVAGGATCAAANTAFPCSLPPGGSVTVQSNTYVIDSGDPDPLPDQGQIVWNDTCNGPDVGCNTQTNTANAPAQTNIVPCIVAADCGTDPGICADRTCIANVCGVQNVANTTECRAANGICDPAESCLDGVCPADGFASNTTECRAANGICDPAESCLNGVCPANGFASDTTECRAANGICDPAESCLSGVCPANGFASDTTECRAGNGVCDPPESCLSGVCPANGFAPGTTECRAGDPATCNPSESCPGTSGTCPADVNPGCLPTACRTVGYWGTHGGSEKGAANITQLTMNVGGGSLNICGETLTNTSVNSPASALEGICDSGGGKTQLVRQLIALSLNCISSGGPPTCVGITPFQSVFTQCNTACAVGTDEEIGACVPLVDCLNNGGTGAVGQNGFFCATGKCSDNQEPCTNQDRSLCGDPGTATCVNEASCHDRALLFPDSPASSPKACNDARKNDCTIFSSSCP